MSCSKPCSWADESDESCSNFSSAENAPSGLLEQLLIEAIARVKTTMLAMKRGFLVDFMVDNLKWESN